MESREDCPRRTRYLALRQGQSKVVMMMLFARYGSEWARGGALSISQLYLHLA
jgi:hypothetical protein